MFEHPSGGRVYGQGGHHCFVVLGAYDGKPATVGNGSMFGFRFDTREEVDAFHARALVLGGSDEGVPGERAPNFYMSYFRDLGSARITLGFEERPLALSRCRLLRMTAIG